MEVERTDIEEGYMQEPTKVRNEDIPLLASILGIMQEIRCIEERREFQKERMLNITQHLSSTPGGRSGTKGLDDIFSIISELDTEHERECSNYVSKIKRAEKILNQIESENMRAFVMLKYIMDVPDTEIRNELNISRRGFDRAKSCIESAQNMASVNWQERYVVVHD